MGDMIQFDTQAGPGTAYLATPESGHGPGVELLHAWWGLTDFFKGLADRLAAEGFVTIAPDLYGNGATADTIPEAEQLVNNERYQDTLQRAQGAMDYLLVQTTAKGDRVGVIGFSFGGAYAAMLSMLRPEVAATVLFYGGADVPAYKSDFASRANGAFLGHFAQHDEYEPEEAVPQTEDQLRKAGREATFYVYPGTGHWFFEDNRPDAYNDAAARLAWQRTIDFLHSKLG